MTLFRLPDLGEGLQEAEIVAWHVTVGDQVNADQPLVSVETEKAAVEVPCPQAGRIVRLCAEVGKLVAVGAPLVEFADAASDKAPTSLVGELPSAPAGEPAAAPAAAREAAKVRAAPAVRARARALGIDLADLTGTGPDGAIVMADLDAADHADGSAPLRGARRWMARAMARAHAEVVPATLTDEADIEPWAAPDAAVTQRLIRAICAGCRAEPALNAWFDARRQSRRLHREVDLGIAVDLPDGLVVPVLRQAERSDGASLQQRLEELVRLASARRLSPEDLRGPTITLSNFGTLAGWHAALVIVPPQVAILGAGRAAARLRVRDGAPAARTLLPLSLTFDHRAVTGGEAGRFLAAVIADLETPD